LQAFSEIKAAERVAFGRDQDIIGGMLSGQEGADRFTYAMLVTLADVDAYQEYMESPLHVEADRRLLPLIEETMSFDICDEWDPSMAQQMRTIVANRPKRIPGYAEVLAAMAAKLLELRGIREGRILQGLSGDDRTDEPSS
jgi:hypothetical protein